VANELSSRQAVKVDGDDLALVARLTEPLQRALADRHSFYAVHIDAMDRVGEVVVSIDGTHGHVPLLFRSEDLEPGYVCRVVKDTVRQYDI
jgi:hypothetical protein